MRIVIATGIYPPEIGGPARYAELLAEAFAKKGHKMSIVSYGDRGDKIMQKDITLFTVSRKTRAPFRHIMYFFILLRASLTADAILALDDFSVGFPAGVLSALTKKKLFFRLGGDFLWEKAVENELTDLPLREFHEKKLPQKLRPFQKFIAFALRGAHGIIFSTKFQRDIYVKYYELFDERTVVIQNPIFKAPAHDLSHKKAHNIVFAGRFLRLKNLSRLIEAFRKVREARAEAKLILIGEGPQEERLKKFVHDENIEGVEFVPRMSRADLLQAISEARFFALPSVSDVSPNVILDCVALQKPFLITKETGLLESLGGAGVLVDPRNTEDIALKMIYLFDDEHLATEREKLKSATQTSPDEFVKEVTTFIEGKL